MRMYRYRKRDFKESAHMIMEVGKSKICKVGCQVGDPGEELMLQFESDRSQLT